VNGIWFCVLLYLHYKPLVLVRGAFSAGRCSLRLLQILEFVAVIILNSFILNS